MPFDFYWAGGVGFTRAHVDHFGARAEKKERHRQSCTGEDVSPENVYFSVNVAERQKFSRSLRHFDLSESEGEGLRPWRLLWCLFKEQPVSAPYFISAGEQLLEST